MICPTNQAGGKRYAELIDVIALDELSEKAWSPLA